MSDRATRPFKQHQSSTVFLRVPSQDWTKVTSGRQTEFRASAGNAPQLWNVPLPTFAICYRKRRAAGAYDTELMVLEAVRQEALGAISEEGLVRAGYPGPRAEAFARFRRDWTISQKRKFMPMRRFFVFRVRKPEDGDVGSIGRSLVTWLYGDFLHGLQ